MFVLLAGSVEVRGSGNQVLARMGRGDLFGEISLSSESRRTADVVAAEDLEVLLLTQDFLERSMKSIPDVRRQGPVQPNQDPVRPPRRQHPATNRQRGRQNARGGGRRRGLG